MAEDPGRRLEPVQLDICVPEDQPDPCWTKSFHPNPVHIVREPLRPAVHGMEPAKPKFIGILNFADVAAHAVQI